MFGQIQNLWSVFKGIDSPSNLNQIQQSIVTFDSQISDEQVSKEATVSACFHVISQAIAQLPISSQNTTLNKLFLKPNNSMNTSVFLQHVIFDMYYYGNSYWEIIRTGNRVSQLLRLLPKDVEVSINSVPELVYRNKRDSNRLIKNRDILHFKDIVKDNETLGRSRLEGAGNLIKAKIAIDRRITDTALNGLDQIVHVKVTGGQLSTENENKLKEQLDRMKRSGNAKRDKDRYFISKNNVDFNVIEGMTLENSDARAVRANLINEICGVIGVPASIIGATNSSEKFNNLRLRNATLHSGCLSSFINSIQNELQMKFNNNTIKIDTTTFLKGDVESSIKVVESLLKAGIWSINEAREYLNQDRIDEPYADERVRDSQSITITPAATNNADGPGGSDNRDRENEPAAQEQNENN